MTSKARQLADLGGDTANLEDISSVLSSGPLSNRNLIINGAMQVAQRGTSQTTALYKSLDRWRVTNNSLAATEYVFEQVEDAPTGFQYSLKTTITATETMTADDRLAVATILEGQDIAKLSFGTASAKTITISFWTKASITGTYSVNIWNGNLSRGYSVGYTVSSANTWEYQTITINGDTGGIWTTDSGRGLWVVFTYSAGPDRYAASSWSDVYGNAVSGQVNMTETLNATFQITGVQLEVGDTATPFEHRSYGQELALCQRYYYRHADHSWFNANANIGNGFYYSSTEIMAIVPFPVSMRTQPSLEQASGTNYYAFQRSGTTDGFNSFILSTATYNTAKLFVNANVSGTAGDSGQLQTETNGVVSFDAEL